MKTLERGGVPILERAPSAWTADERFEPLPSSLLALVKNRSIGFSTSGSQGLPSLYQKPGHWLLRESETLLRLWSLGQGHVISLVWPGHLYGFLFSVLMPCQQQSRVAFGPILPSQAGNRPVLQTIVATPAHWPQVGWLRQHWAVTRVFSSGAALGPSHLAQWAAWNESWGEEPDLIEIFGSTETGGVGWRTGGEEYFHIFQDVHFDWCEQPDTPPKVYSPWCPVPFALQDLLLPCANGQGFISLGRIDRIFKWGGQRHSLDAIERILIEALPVKICKAFFLLDPSRRKGGSLEVFYAPHEMTPPSESDFRRRIPEGLPFPERWLRVSDWPKHVHDKGSYQILYQAHKKCQKEETTGYDHLVPRKTSADILCRTFNDES